MTDKSIELLIEVPAETKLAIERAAAARTLSVAAFLEVSLRKYLADAGYIDEDAADRGGNAADFSVAAEQLNFCSFFGTAHCDLRPAPLSPSANHRGWVGFHKQSIFEPGRPQRYNACGLFTSAPLYNFLHAAFLFALREVSLARTARAMRS